MCREVEDPWQIGSSQVLFACFENPTFPATFGALRSSVSATWAGLGSRERFVEAICSSRVRARLTQYISNHHPVKNSTISPFTLPSNLVLAPSPFHL